MTLCPTVTLPQKRGFLSFGIITVTVVNVVLQLYVFYFVWPRKDTGTVNKNLYIVTGQRAMKNYVDSGQHTTKNHTNNLQVTEDKQKLSGRRNESDNVVFFIGGGKSGSTTLATYLKHDPNNWKQWDPNGQFLDGGKEFCWSKSRRSKKQFWEHFTDHGSKTAIFALDACPQATEKVHFERMVKTFPNASYLMLVRDPVDRVISHINDMLDPNVKNVTNRVIPPKNTKVHPNSKRVRIARVISDISRRKNRSIEDFLKGNVANKGLVTKLSMFGQILQNAYSVLPREKIMIVSNQDLKKHPQETIDKVMKHIGARRKKISLIEVNKRNDRSTYQIPSNTTLYRLRTAFYRDWQLFKNLSGLNIDTKYM